MAHETVTTLKVLALVVEGLILGGIGAFLGLQDLSGKTELVVLLLLVAAGSLITFVGVFRQKKNTGKGE